MKFMQNHHKVNRNNYPDWELASTLDFAEDFLHLTWEDVRTLPQDQHDAIEELKGFFMDVPEDVLESICAEGLGENWEELYAHAVDGVILPKFVRDYAESTYHLSWEDIEWRGAVFAKDFRNEAYVKTYGPWPEYDGTE